MRPKKELGQNFLKDEKVIADLIAAAEIQAADVVLEVGAGTGAVTQQLAPQAQKVIAVEFDRDLIPKLTVNLSPFKNVTILNASILDLPLNELSVASCQPACHCLRPQALASGLPVNKIVGAIPYQITSPLFHKIIFEQPPVQKMAFIIQKEVAEKIAAQPPRASYWSNFVQLYAQVKIEQTVPPSAFAPPPKVESAIISILFDKRPAIPPPKWSSFLHRGFAHPRQMLNKAFPLERLKEAGIDPSRRPQTLALEEWQTLFAILEL